MLATFALARAVGSRAAIRTQVSLIASAWSVPEPDVAVVPGSLEDYCDAHPTSALLVVEVSDSSLKQDRLSKSRIYAAANVPEYWIVNLRESVVEVMRDPDPATALYRDTRLCNAGDEIELATLPGARVAVADLLPKRG
jgi:Uma2 family endonuclease